MRMTAAITAALAASALLADGKVSFDAEKHSVTFTATSTDCGMDTQLEFLFVGPGSDHDYESMFVTDSSVTEIAEAFRKAGIPVGRDIDEKGCRFWPVGCQLRMEPSFASMVKEMRGAAVPPIIFTGGLRDAKGVPEAETNMPAAVFALYNCRQSLIQLDDALDQSATYGRFQPGVKIPKGEKRTFTFSWNGEQGWESVDLALESGKIGEALVSLKKKSEKRELTVLPRFSPEMTLKEAADAATALSMIDSARVKINGFAEGQFFYRAFLPLEQWRDRKERLAQPPEVHFNDDGGFTVVRITEDWSDPNSTDPRLVVKEHPCKTLAEAAKLADDFTGNTLSALVYASPTTKLSRLYDFRKAVKSGIVNWYMFQEQ